MNLSLVKVDTYSSADYITSSAGNIFHRTAEVKEPSNVELPGGKCILKEDVLIRGDLCSIQINAYTIIETKSKLKPSHIDMNKEGDEVKYIPLTIGKYTYIGKKCVIERESYNGSVHPKLRFFFLKTYLESYFQR